MLDTRGICHASSNIPYLKPERKMQIEKNNARLKINTNFFIEISFLIRLFFLKQIKTRNDKAGSVNSAK